MGLAIYHSVVTGIPTVRRSRHLVVDWDDGRMGRRSGFGRNIKETGLPYVFIENKAEDEEGFGFRGSVSAKPIMLEVHEGLQCL